METTPQSIDSSAQSTKAVSSVRRFLESAVLFLSAVILLRSIALEPFGVPTGSMAMTLVGNHKSCPCPRCGFPITIGSSAAPAGEATSAQAAYTSGWCPNCGQGNLRLDEIRETAGDRLMVDKNIYEMRRPRRWEIAVFRCPSDVTKPYVKRIAGLPGERIQVKDGDVYINSELARKVLEESRATRVLLFDNNYQPRDGGWRPRWRVGQPDGNAVEKSLAEADEYLDGTTLRWLASASQNMRWLVYRNWLLDEKREEQIRDQFAYNGSGHRHELGNIHDFYVELQIEPGSGSGEFAIALSDGADQVTAAMPIGGVAAGSETQTVRIMNARGKILAVGPEWRMSEGRSYRIEMSFFDRRICLAIDGTEIMSAIDLPPVATRQPVSRPVWLGVTGAPAKVTNLRIYRDIHYASTGRNGIGEPWPLGAREYFMLGDNSSNSEDSRFWSIPGVPEENLLGRPLLLHQPSRWTTIAERWDVQSLDWRRVRWVH